MSTWLLHKNESCFPPPLRRKALASKASLRQCSFHSLEGADVVCLARDEGDKASGGNATFSGTFLPQLTAYEANESNKWVVGGPHKGTLLNMVRQEKGKHIKNKTCE